MKRIFVFSAVILVACSSRHTTTDLLPAKNSVVVNGKLFATFYQQRAAEYKALCFQAFNIAQLRLDQFQPAVGKPMAIITDIDETVLDNSAYEAHQTLQGKDYDPASWYEWTNRASADTVPGAPAFLKYASSKGVEIFYITQFFLYSIFLPSNIYYFTQKSPGTRITGMIKNFLRGPLF